VGSYQLGT